MALIFHMQLRHDFTFTCAACMRCEMAFWECSQRKCMETARQASYLSFSRPEMGFCATIKKKWHNFIIGGFSFTGRFFFDKRWWIQASFHFDIWNSLTHSRSLTIWTPFTMQQPQLNSTSHKSADETDRRGPTFLA